MSLEPDISIIENKHYVSVRGALKLTGEYRPIESDAEERDELSIDEERALGERPALRPIDELTVSEDGIAQIEHRFPVDITIPLSRIERLEDIFVTVDSFDYTLPENDCLRLEADISISGMAEEPESQTEDALGGEMEADEIETVAKASEVRKEETVEAKEEDWKDDEAYRPFHYEAVRKVSEEERDGADHSSFGNPNRGPLVEMKSKATETEDESTDYSDEWEEDTEEYVEEDDREFADEEEESVSQREENALYLTKMLTKDEEEFSRLKMCIIQPGESLDTIAERYALTSSQLARVNHLDNEEVEEGQILYIPVSSSR
jgi:stage VI sporulation protein D